MPDTKEQATPRTGYSHAVCYYCHGEPHAIKNCPACQNLETTRELLLKSGTELVALNQRLAAMEEALKPFAHPDLSESLGGNVEGDESPVFGRNKAMLRLKHFQAAARLQQREGGK